MVDLADFKGISLALTTRHTKFRFYEHFVQKIELSPFENGTRYKFPLKEKYERANTNILAIGRPTEAAGDPLSDPGQPPEGINLEDMGQSTLGPATRGMYGRDRRGKSTLSTNGELRLPSTGNQVCYIGQKAYHRMNGTRHPST